MRGLMWTAIILAAAAVLAAHSWAANVTVTLTDQDQANWAAISNAFDQCVAGSVNRGDGSSCRAVSSYLSQFANEVKTATPTTTSTPVSPSSPDPSK